MDENTTSATCTPKADKELATESKANRLFSLPQELRDEIYILVLFPSNPTKDRWTQDRHLPALDGYTNCTEWAPPTLSQVSSQVRSEVLDIWYSHANFIFHFRIPQTLDVLRKTLRYVGSTRPDALLRFFFINWRTLGIGWVEPFVGLTQIFGMYGKHVPVGLINFGTAESEWRDPLPRTCELLQDLIDLGRGLDDGILEDRVAIREKILEMMMVKTGDVERDDFRSRTRHSWVARDFRDPRNFVRATE